MALAHVVTQKVDAPAPRAFDFLRDPVLLGRWSLGCFGTFPVGSNGLYAGRSLFDGSEGWFRIEANPESLTVDYLVGPQDALRRRISARVVPGLELGYAPGICLVTLTAWRSAGMEDERWLRLCASHEAEIFLIKGQIEALQRDDHLQALQDALTSPDLIL